MLSSIVLLLITINLTASFTSPSFLMEYRARAIAVAMSSTGNPVDVRNLVIPEDKLLFSYARCSGPGKLN